MSEFFSEIKSLYDRSLQILNLKRGVRRNPASAGVHFGDTDSLISGGPGGSARWSRRPEFKFFSGPTTYLPVLTLYSRGNGKKKFRDFLGRGQILQCSKTSLWTPLVVVLLTVLSEEDFELFCHCDLSKMSAVEEAIRICAFGAHLTFSDDLYVETLSIGPESMISWSSTVLASCSFTRKNNYRNRQIQRNSPSDASSR